VRVGGLQAPLLLEALSTHFEGGLARSYKPFKQAAFLADSLPGAALTHNRALKKSEGNPGSTELGSETNHFR
jgi:hypothetical protein